jgi:hypothetical protein
MAEAIYKNVGIYVGSYNVAGDANQVGVDDGGKDTDTTTFAHDARRFRPTLPDPSFSVQGFVTFGADKVEAKLRANKGVNGVPFTVLPQGANTADGVAIFIPSGVQGNFNIGAEVGQALPFNVAGKAQGEPLVNGRVFVLAGVKSANGTSNALSLGPVAAGQKVYGVIHVLSANGTTPTLDVTVERDSVSSFDDDPQTVLTFAQKDAAGYEAVANTAADTDAYYRVSYDLGGTDPEFSFVVVVGVY